MIDASTYGKPELWIAHREVFDIAVDRNQPCMSWVEKTGEAIYLPGLPRYKITITVRRAPGTFLIDHVGREVRFTLEFYDTRYTFHAYVSSVDYDGRFGHFTCKLTGVTNLQTTPLSQAVIKEKSMATFRTSGQGIQIPKDRREILARRYYVGSKQIFPGGNNANWGQTTLSDAEAHATKLIEETGEDQFIVKIVRVVRKRPTPVDIEKV